MSGSTHLPPVAVCGIAQLMYRPGWPANRAFCHPAVPSTRKLMLWSFVIAFGARTGPDILQTNDRQNPDSNRNVDTVMPE